MRLPPNPVKDEGLPTFVMKGESFPRDLEPLYRRQRVRHLLFLPE